jgi:heme exporter protein D
MAEFLHMGGYAFYVWTSFGLAALLLAGLAVWASVTHKRELARISRNLRREKRSV